MARPSSSSQNWPLTCIKVVVLGGIVAAFVLPLITDLLASAPTDLPTAPAE